MQVYDGDVSVHKYMFIPYVCNCMRYVLQLNF